MAEGGRTQEVAAHLECDAATIWRTCRRYEDGGLAGLLASPPRAGRPERISPPPAGATRRAGGSGAPRQGTASDPLVECGLGARGGARRDRGGDQRRDRAPHPGSG
ncbi:MAG: helix-turn-helix domain-containing protein [Gemmatimonadaceae bacterium]